ncbi:MAG: transposase, partial [Bacteroidales bacterium]|nr:transposase [Bacteroidales bacterium]
RMRQTILAHPRNKLEKQLINLFHSSDLPLHFNKTGNKEFTNYQRISIIILLKRSGKSLRQFIDENLSESKWVSWLGLKKIPKKSTLHDWLKMFSMKTIRQLCKLLIPKKVKLTAIDSTGIDSFRRSKHYEKRCNELGDLPHMTYAKTSLFIDVESKIVLDWDLVMSHEHDVKIAERIFKRNKIKNIYGLGDKGFDSENLHEIARANGIDFFAPVRKMDKRSFKDQRPKGFYRRQCKENPPKFKGMRSIVENVNYVLKETQIASLRSKKHSMRERELGWHLIFYNIKKIIGLTKSKEIQTFFILKIKIYVFPDNAKKSIVL